MTDLIAQQEPTLREASREDDENKYPLLLLSSDDNLSAAFTGVTAAKMGLTIDTLPTIEQMRGLHPGKPDGWYKQYRAAIIECYNGAKADLGQRSPLPESFEDFESRLLAALLGDPSEMAAALASSDDSH